MRTSTLIIQAIIDMNMLLFIGCLQHVSNSRTWKDGIVPVIVSSDTLNSIDEHILSEKATSNTLYLAKCDGVALAEYPKLQPLYLPPARYDIVWPENGLRCDSPYGLGLTGGEDGEGSLAEISRNFCPHVPLINIYSPDDNGVWFSECGGFKWPQPEGKYLFLETHYGCDGNFPPTRLTIFINNPKGYEKIFDCYFHRFQEAHWCFSDENELIIHTHFKNWKVVFE